MLGRHKSARREPDAPTGYRNGFGKERRLSTSIGTVRVRRPRVRNVPEPFVSRVLPLFQRRTQEVGKLLPTLYLHGLSTGDFELAMRGLLGDGAPLSASSIARLRESWTAEHITWKNRRLEDSHVVYLWVDGVYVKAGLEKDKAALLGGNRCHDGRDQARVGRRVWTAGEPGELGGAVARPQSPGDELPQPGDGRRGSGDLVGAGPGLSGGCGAALLEPPDAQCSGPGGPAQAGGGQGVAAQDHVCSHA